jgi:hypothetical protein
MVSTNHCIEKNNVQSDPQSGRVSDLVIDPPYFMFLLVLSLVVTLQKKKGFWPLQAGRVGLLSKLQG